MIQIDGITDLVQVLRFSSSRRILSCVHDRRLFAILFSLNLLRQLRHLPNERAASERILVHNFTIDNARGSQSLTYIFCVNGLVIVQFFNSYLFFRQRADVFQFRLRHIPATRNQGIHPLDHLRPAELNRRAAFLLQLDALAVMAFAAVVGTRHRMGAPADAVLFFQIICLFLGRMRGICRKETVDPFLAASHAAPAGKLRIHLILRDEGRWPCHLRQQGFVLPAGKGKLPDRLSQGRWVVETEPQELLVLRIGIGKGIHLGGNAGQKSRISQAFSQSSRFVWKTAATDGFHRGKKGFRFGRCISIKIPQALGDHGAFMRRSRRQLHHAHELPAFQQLSDASCGILPRHDLRNPGIARRPAGREENPVLRVPCADAPMLRDHTVAAVINLPENLRHFFSRLSLGKLSRQNQTVIGSVAARAQDVIHVLLQNRKSEGHRRDALRFHGINQCDLFRFAGDDEAHLLQHGVIIRQV